MYQGLYARLHNHLLDQHLLRRQLAPKRPALRQPYGSKSGSQNQH